MAAPTVDIEVNQGATFKIKMTITNETTMTPIDVSDYAFCGGVRQTVYDDETFKYTFVKTDPVNGIVEAILTPEVSSQLDFLKGVHDISYERTDGTVIRIMQGTVTVSLGGIGCQT